MPIFDQGYQHWNGHLTGQLLRWTAITRQGIRAQLKNRMVRIWAMVCFGPAVTLLAFMIAWSLFEQGNAAISPFLQFVPEYLRKIPQDYRLTVWTLAYHYFFFIQLFLLMMLVLLVGPNLISNDMRFNALPLYLSRPVRRWEYFLGKFGVIAFFVLLVTAVPATVAWLLGVLFSLSFSAVVELTPLLLGSWLVSLVAAGTYGLWMLALSSLSRNSRYVAMMWFAWCLMTFVLSLALTGLLRGEEWPGILDFRQNVQRLEEMVLNTDRAWAQVDDAFSKGQQAVSNVRGGPGVLLEQGFRQATGGRRHIGASLIRRRDGTVIERSSFFRSLYPWTWSAGVLAGLGVLSLCILTFRVRSLDRLR